jgi:hypothetical protein
MSNLEEILGIRFTKGTKILHATNSSKKVKKNSIFLAYLELINMEANIQKMHWIKEHQLLFIMT